MNRLKLTSIVMAAVIALLLAVQPVSATRNWFPGPIEEDDDGNGQTM